MSFHFIPSQSVTYVVGGSQFFVRIGLQASAFVIFVLFGDVGFPRCWIGGRNGHYLVVGLTREYEGVERSASSEEMHDDGSYYYAHNIV